MLKLKKIAVTGGIASGKSTVCSLFQKLGAYIVSTDALAHELLEDSHTELGLRVIQLFGSDILQDGKINKSIVASKVFRDEYALQKLEMLLHPLILQGVENEYLEACRVATAKAFIVEIPLLFEIGVETSYDVVITVVSGAEVAIKRFLGRGHSEEEYDRRMKHQIPPEIKAAKANYTIVNNGTLEDLAIEVTKLSKELFIHAK